MKELNKTESLLKNILLFLISNFLPRAIVFFMVPLYTYCLTTEQYGTVDLMITTIHLLQPFLTIQMQDAMLRFSMEKANNPSDVLTIGVRTCIIGAILLCAVCLVGSLSGIIPLNSTYVVLFLIMYFTSSIKTIMSYFCRGINKIGILTSSNIILTIVTVLCNLVFLLVFKWNINGYLLSTCIGNSTGLLTMFFGAGLYRYIKFRPKDKTLTKSIICFSIPMVFSALSWWINTSLDKYVLKFFWSSSAVGLMAVAYKIPTILSLFGTTIANAYSISAIRNFDKDDTDGFLGKSYSMINIVFVMMCSGLMLFNMLIAKILFLEDFFVAWKIVPPLLMSALFSQLSLTLEQFYISIKKTKIISATAVTGASLNAILNFLLIPRFAAYGAAVATASSFFLAWAIRYFILRKYLRLKHNFIAECATYFLLVLQMVFAYFGNRFIICQAIIVVLIYVLYSKEINGILSAMIGKLRRGIR